MPCGHVRHTGSSHVKYLIYLLVGLAFGFGGFKLAENKGQNPVVGGLLGFFCGIIGLIIILILPKKN